MSHSWLERTVSVIDFLVVRRTRARLLAHAHGRVLEVGVGTGLNLAHYPPGANVVGLDPDGRVLAYARRRAARLATHGLTFATAEGSAASLPFPDATFDTVVSTLVFCSIDDPRRAAAEVVRVLKPGGRWLLMEHGRPEGARLGRLAERLTPGWARLSGGCHLDRHPESYFDGLGVTPREEFRFWRGIGRCWVLVRDGSG